MRPSLALHGPVITLVAALPPPPEHPDNVKASATAKMTGLSFENIVSPPLVDIRRAVGALPEGIPCPAAG
jgi:hypothetical protein